LLKKPSSFEMSYYHTIKTSSKFHSLKRPCYKQSVYLIKLQKQLVWIL